MTRILRCSYSKCQGTEHGPKLEVFVMSECNADQRAKGMQQVLAAYIHYQTFALWEYYIPRLENGKCTLAIEMDWSLEWIISRYYLISCNALFLSEWWCLQKILKGTSV